MNFIAHRGNTLGPQPTFENTEDYLQDAIDKGYHVEVDIQLWNGALYYGHDEPNKHINEKFIQRWEVICHAKTFETMGPLLDLGCHTFFHQEDDITLTSRGKIWCFPGNFPIHPDAIWLDLHNKPLPDVIPNIWGICGDDARIMHKLET